MQTEIENKKADSIHTISGHQNLRITCVERKYKVSNSKMGFIVIAKKEVDENITQELLYEDTELRNFLEKYEIAEILPEAVCKGSFDTADKNLSERNPTLDRVLKKSRIQIEAMKRRELFDSLNLPEIFVIKDYKKALEDKGIKITNNAMPYDDMDWFEKQGKITRTGIGERGTVSFIKK
jgi:hypothetical protein